MKKRKKKILLGVLAGVAALLLTGCGPSSSTTQTTTSQTASASEASGSSQPSSTPQVSSTASQSEPLSQEWRKIDSIADYQGLLDSSITQISLYCPEDRPYYRVTFSDEDLLAIWSDYLDELELQEYVRYSQEDQRQLAGTPPPTVTITTETGEYTMYFCLGISEINHTGVRGEETLEYREWEDGNYRLQSGGLIYTLSDPENFPFDQTYEIAAQRHGETGPG